MTCGDVIYALLFHRIKQCAELYRFIALYAGVRRSARKIALYETFLYRIGKQIPHIKQIMRYAEFCRYRLCVLDVTCRTAKSAVVRSSAVVQFQRITADIIFILQQHKSHRAVHSAAHRYR